MLDDILQQVTELKDKFNFPKENIQQAEIQLKYESYIEKEKEIAARISKMENLKIPQDFNYDKVSALSMESLLKLKKIIKQFTEL